MRLRNRFNLRTLSICLGLALILGSGAAKAEKIVIGTMNWAYMQVMSNVLKVLIEDNYGEEVEFVPGKHAMFFKAMDNGKGEVDIFPDFWLPNNQGMADEYVTDRGTVAITQGTFTGRDAFCTTKYTKDTLGLNTIYDLAKPEVVQALDTNGDGLGELWLGGPGWTSTEYHKVQARDYGFNDLYELQEYEEALVISKIDAAVKANKALVFACYAPHHIFGLHEIIDEGEHDPEKWTAVHPSDSTNWYEESHMATSFPLSTSYIAYSKRLDTTAPEVVNFLNRVVFGTALINEWSAAIDVDKRDAVDYSKEWIAENTDTVDAWLGR